MSKKYRVSCYSPPSALKIKDGMDCEVSGRGSGDKITADSVRVLGAEGFTCDCGEPPFTVKMDLFSLRKTVSGKASNLRFGNGYVEFDLTTQP